MECRRTDELLSAYLDGDLPERERAGFAEHLRQCPRCTGEEKALKETLSLLRNLPPVQAPSGLLEGVRRRIAQEKEEVPLWRKLLLPAHFGIPLGAAAVVLIFLLAYGIQKEIPATKVPRSSPAQEMKVAKASPSPPAAVESAKPAKSGAGEAIRRKTGSSPMPPEAASGRPGAAKPVPTDAGEKAPVETERPDMAVPPSVAPPVLAKSEIPAGLASRVSTRSETIEPAPPRESPAAEEAREPRGTGEQLSLLQRPPPYGRELTIEVARDDRVGIEDRISALALRLGGGIRRGGAFTASRDTGEVTILGEILQVRIPAVSEGTFLKELGTMGTIPPGETTGKTDLSADSSSDSVVYTVRIVVK